MTTHSISHEKGYLMVPHALLDNPEISWNAKILWMSIARHDPSRWTFYAEHIRKGIGWCKDTFYKAMKELKDALLINCTVKRKANGHFAGNTWVVSCGSRSPENRDTGCRDTGKLATNKIKPPIHPARPICS